MNKPFSVAILVIVSAIFCCVAQAQSNNAPLTNKDIVELVKTGLSAEVIVAKIKNSPSNFDTSPAALHDLKAANVPESIILAMVQAPGPTNQTASPSSDKPTAKTGVKNLYEVQKIYVDEMGKSDDSERFRELVREKLPDKGFTVVENPDDADAILKGTLATQLSQERQRRERLFISSRKVA